MITLYGAPGWGSAISELMLRLAEIPYRVENVEGFDSPGPQRDRLRQFNPLCQVPTLVLDDGSVMTESAAIALMILDHRPHLAPPPGTPERLQFQRLLIWLVASVYPTFTYADYRRMRRSNWKTTWFATVSHCCYGWNSSSKPRLMRWGSS